MVRPRTPHAPDDRPIKERFKSSKLWLTEETDRPFTKPHKLWTSENMHEALEAAALAREWDIPHVVRYCVRQMYVKGLLI
jgi:hypothetical protein